ncbi:MAG TPA: DMT family transporter [Stellaceae bacterium]|nr:DMT family transporter [Stellaceae bacterium]
MPTLVQFSAFALLAIAAGASFVVQGVANSRLSIDLGSAYWAAFFSYLGGTIVMLLVIAVTRTAWPGGTIARPPLLAWTGGFWGAIYVVAIILLMPRLGAATVIALLVAGQMLSALVFDNFAAFGLPQHPVDLSRVVGAVLLVGGVVLIRN